MILVSNDYVILEQAIRSDDFFPPEVPVIVWKLAPLLKQKGWTAYRLAKETGFNGQRAYSLAKPGAKFRAYKDSTLDILCATLGCQPGDLLEWVPDVPAGRGGRSGRGREASRSPHRRGSLN